MPLFDQKVISLVCTYLCKIMIHNITPSAEDYLTKAQQNARKMVPEVGLEPTWALSPLDFESSAYTNFATPACEFKMIRSARPVVQELRFDQHLDYDPPFCLVKIRFDAGGDLLLG